MNAFSLHYSGFCSPSVDPSTGLNAVKGEEEVSKCGDVADVDPRANENVKSANGCGSRKYKRDMKSSSANSDPNKIQTLDARDAPNYNVGLYGDSYADDGWPTVPSDQDDFYVSVVLPESYTVLQKYCQGPGSMEFNLSKCSCSVGGHACLQLTTKSKVEQQNPFASGSLFKVQNTCVDTAERVVGCSCEWKNTCDYVVYANPQLSIECTPC